MTKQEARRITAQWHTLLSLGFTVGEAGSLRRISMTLRRWHELECGVDGGCIERDETTDKPYWYNSISGRRSPVADREKGALKRLAAILGQRNARSSGTLTSYIQGDPRGAALYLIRPGDVPDGQSVDSYYTRGICVY